MRKLCIIATGGTIGAHADKSGISLRPPEDSIIRELLSIHPSTKHINTPDFFHPFTLLSEDMSPIHWEKLATCISDRIEEGYQGIIIAHGTDTMAYSISAVSFMLGGKTGITVPIVFTGALIPYGEEASDAAQNLADAVIFANKYDYAGIFLVFQTDRRIGKRMDSSSVFWGPRVQSMRPGGKSFETVDNHFIALVRNGEIQSPKDNFRYPLRSGQKNKRDQRDSNPIDTRYNENVSVLKVYPGFQPKVIDMVVEMGAKAIIVDLYHSGTACTLENSHSIVNPIKRATENGICVLGAGAPFRNNEQYKSTSALVRAGLIPLGRMSLEATVAKAMCLLGRDISGDALGSAMDKHIAHEIYSGTQG